MGSLRSPADEPASRSARLALLHAGLLLRVIGGDVLDIPGAWRLGGTLNVVAVLVFLVVSIAAAGTGTWHRGRRSRHSS